MLPLVDDFLLDLQANNYSVGTVEAYKRYLVAFNCFLDENNISFDEINRQTITAYKAHLASGGKNTANQGIHSDRPPTPHTINYKLVGLRVYLRYLISIDYASPIAPETVENLKVVSKQPQVPGIRDLIRLIEAPSPQANIRELRDKAILETLFHTGLKVSELVSLDRDQVDLEHNRLALKGKGLKIRILLLPNPVAQWIDRYLQSRQDHFRPLFVRHSGERDTRKDGERMRLTVRSIQRIVIKYAARCGLSIRATPETLRHCFAAYLIEESANAVPLRVLFGHQSLDAVTRYVHA